MEAKLTVKLNRTIAEIFLPYFTLTIAVLSCFKQKKSVLFGGFGAYSAP